jgi:3-dehydroquinate dehydratase-2
MRRVLVIHGPNLNLLGTREPEIYGRTTLPELRRMIRGEARSRGLRAVFYQSNHEGRIIDRIHRARRGGFAGLLINPGALTHYSYSLRDAIAATGVRAVEVHLSDISNREEFRKVSVVREVCAAAVSGKGPGGYVEALDILLGL